MICLASLPIDVYNKRPASSESSDFVFLTYLSISAGRLQSVGALISHSDNDSKVKLSGWEFGFLGEEERPILANSEFLFTDTSAWTECISY